MSQHNATTKLLIILLLIGSTTAYEYLPQKLSTPKSYWKQADVITYFGNLNGIDNNTATTSSFGPLTGSLNEARLTYNLTTTPGGTKYIQGINMSMKATHKTPLTLEFMVYNSSYPSGLTVSSCTTSMDDTQHWYYCQLPKPIYAYSIGYHIPLTPAPGDYIGVAAYEIHANIKTLPNNASCTANCECTSLTCVSSICGQVNGGACTDDSQCRQGACYGGTCTTASTPGCVFTNLTYINQYPSYNIRRWTWRNDVNNNLYSFTNQNATLQVWCEHYSSRTYNLTQIAPSSNASFYTKENAIYITNLNNKETRIRQDPENILTDNYYLSPTISNLNIYTFTLQDFTGGQFYRAYVQVKAAVNDSVGIIHSERFDQSGRLTVNLVNGTYYSLYIRGDNAVRDIGPIRASSDELARTIVITQPVITDPINYGRDVHVTFTMDYDNSQVGAVVSTTNTQVSNFTVYNASTSSWVKTYNSGGGSNYAVYTYNVPNKDMPLYVDVVVHHTTYGDLHFSKYMNVYNISSPYNTTAFNPITPTTMLGSSTKTLKMLFSLFITIFVMLVFTKAGSTGIGSLSGVGAFSFFWFNNWIPHTVVPWFIIPVFMVLAFAIAIVERRVV